MQESAGRTHPFNSFVAFLESSAPCFQGPSRSRQFGLRAAAFSLALTLGLTASAAMNSGRIRLENSIKEIRADASVPGPRQSRAELTAAESATPLDFVVTLRMRNYDEFQAILQSGRTVSPADMEARFLPLKSDYDRVAHWLRDHGIATTLVDAHHTNLFVRGTVAGIADALDVSFARVLADNGEFTSAISAPSLPEEFSPAILGIDGLQPHIQMLAAKRPTGEVTTLATHPTRVVPADVRAAYHVPSNLNGAGQTIAVFATALPLASDLATFNQVAGINGNPDGFTVVNVNGGPTVGGGSFNEATLDTQWSSGIAPGASVRVYAAPTGSLTNFLAACTMILNEGVVKIVTSSISSPETSISAASLQSASQLFAQMAAAGITIFHGSGDSGSYGPGAAPEYPTTDPYVTALSGTALTFDTSWNATSESVWSNTGGGPSTIFSRPAWQTGAGVPAGTMRLVPDMAAPSSTVAPGGQAFSFVVLHGATNTGIGGTSLTGPIWAGLTAIINQARANAGLPTLGLLGPRVYPLLGTSAFKDIVTGSNGAYSASAGYDLCSGIGSPNVAALIDALTVVPSIVAQPRSQSVPSGGTAQFSVSVSENPGLSYQWLLNGSPLSGATGSTLTVNPIPADAGLYMAAVTDGLSDAIVKTDAAILGVATTEKIIGNGAEVGANIPHPNGNTYDQVLLSGKAASITADAGQVTRTSFIDLTNDIVQVEFGGAGTLSLVLDNSSGPAAPINYNQPNVGYMKGHVGIVITGANETTNVSVFSVGRFTAFDPTGAFNPTLPVTAANNPLNNASALFSGHSSTVYDGMADVAFIAISSANGKFGGVRASNASFYAAKGTTGLYAPGVEFTGPVFIGDINASDAATPMIMIGSSPDTRITGGDLFQTNGKAVVVSGLTQLKFTLGSNSHGNLLAAQTVQAVLLENGVDVTSQIVVNP
jgi:hypothetical protein